MPCEVPPETTTQVTGAGGPPLAVPVALPRRDLVRREHRRRRPGGTRPEPQPGPDPRSQAYVRQLAPDRRDLLVRQVAHPQRAEREPVPREPLGRAGDLGDLAARGLVERQVQSEALDTVPCQPRRDLLQRRLVQPEPAHRREQLDDDPVPGELVERGGGGDRADEPVVHRGYARPPLSRYGSRTSTSRVVRVGAPPRPRPAPRRRRCPRPAGSPARPAGPRRTRSRCPSRRAPGRVRRRRRRPGAPASGRRRPTASVPSALVCHAGLPRTGPLATGQVELERLVQHRGERVVPLAEVLDGLAAGAQLELDRARTGGRRASSVSEMPRRS